VGVDFTLDETFRLLPHTHEREVIIPAMKYKIVSRTRIRHAGKDGWHLVIEEVGEQ
jgi:hypothetical protein